MHGRNRAVAGQSHTEHFREAIHRVGREHARARAAGRTGLVFQIFKLNRRDFAGTELTYGFADVGVGNLAAFKVTGKHSAA